MSTRYRWLGRGAGALAVVGTIILAATQPTEARDRHRGHHGGGAFFSFGFSSAPYYYDPYPYYGPVYAYPPAYAYPPDYGYGGYDQLYEAAPMPYSDGVDSGPYCREFQTTVVIDGQPQAAHGTACQQPDGTWAVVN